MDVRKPPGVTDSTTLQPPGQPPAAVESASLRWPWAVLAALLLLGISVIFALPGLVGPVDETALPAEPVTPAGDEVAARDTAHQALQTYLQLRARMELDNAAAWGEPEWSATAGLVIDGDRYFAQRQFAAAARDYQAALGRLQQLAANRGPLLASTLGEGTRALAENEVSTAIARFETALAIEAGHPDATRGLERARSRTAVIEQMNQGKAAEANSNLETAGAAYRQAVQLDADYAPAAAALQRVAAQINARDFNTAISQALSSLDAGQTGAAGKALAAAERLRPGDPVVRDAGQRLRAMRTQAGLGRLRRQAQDRVAAEDWQAAMESYRKALLLDPVAGFAREGLQRAEERLALHAQFDHYLDNPARVYSATPLANAEQLLAAASKAPQGEPQLAGKIATLRELVSRARTPVAVTLNSDSATSVVIYRVGRLGQFDTHQLELLPGDYTIVGSRPGYRDVRKVLSVRPGMSRPALLVRCEEVI